MQRIMRKQAATIALVAVVMVPAAMVSGLLGAPRGIWGPLRGFPPRFMPPRPTRFGQEDIKKLPGDWLLAGYWIKSAKEDSSSASIVDYRTEKYSIMDLFSSEAITLDPQERKERYMNLV